MDRPIFIDRVLGRETATLREILAICRATYCGPIGVEFMHIQDPEQKSWIQQPHRGRALDAPPSTPTAKRAILQQLTEAEGFEAFCARKYVAHQALRPGGRRDHHPRAADDDRDRGQGRA